MEYVLPSQKIEEKLAKRGITLEDCVECFVNREGNYLEDKRPEHVTIPPTYWFISTTNANRRLKIVFIYYLLLKEVHIKSAYEPNQDEIDIYRRRG